MKTVRITLLGCLAAVWIVACGQDMAEPPSPDPVDLLYNEDDIDNYHHSAFVVAVWEALGKNPFKATKAELATVTRLPRVRASGFISQRGMDLLAACVNLVELKIVGVNLSNEQLAALAGLTNLRTLDISGNPIADVRLRPVIELPKLTALSASDIGLTDLRPLAGLVNLQHLELWGNDIDDISPLAGLVNLQHLKLWGNKIADLTPLVGLVQLETLNLENNKIVDIQPLLDNIGIGAGDEIGLQGNKLSDISRNQLIPKLEARGARVRW